jgi:hypothetical protein
VVVCGNNKVVSSGGIGLIDSSITLYKKKERTKQRRTMTDNQNESGPMNGGDAAAPSGSVALLSDPVDVIIDKLLR